MESLESFIFPRVPIIIHVYTLLHVAYLIPIYPGAEVRVIMRVFAKLWRYYAKILLAFFV